jgi:hypothetical protein
MAAPTPVALNKLPATALGGDVGVAAPGSKADGYGYVGVWVKDAATCAAIGTPSATDFAVITPSTFRNGPSAVYGNFKGLADGKGTLTAGTQKITLEQTGPDALAVNGVAMVRCVP